MGIVHRLADRLSHTEVWETEHRLLHALGRARPPAAVQWMVTRRCDLACGHCYAQAGRKAFGELDTDEAKRLVVDATAELGCPLLVLAGGELWLRPDIEALIEHAVGRGLDWAMHTHGGHVAKHRELLRRHPPSLAAISLDGDRELHDGFRGKVGSHAAALEAVRVLVDAGCREVVLGTTVTRQNADRIADMFELVVASGAHSWGLHLVAPEGRAELDLVPRPDQLRRIAAFARARRARFPVELCNEWGSAGRDDAHYRDRPFLCGAGRISLVIDPTGEVLPCTTSDLGESEGNVRERSLRLIWRDGFARFRGQDSSCSEGAECWLQTRNGVRIAEAAFGRVARPRPKLADLVPPRLVALGHRTLAPRTHEGGFASSATRRIVGAAAFGLAFLSACTQPRSPSDEPIREPGSAEPELDRSACEAAGALVHVDLDWPADLDLTRYGEWSDMRSTWKTRILPDVLAWERGGPTPTIAGETGQAGEVTTLEAELSRHVAQPFGARSLADLLALLDAAERASLFDPAFAAHLWRAAERVPARADRRSLEQRATLYGRLAHHHHVAAALVSTAATIGPITQRAWLKKSAPPPDWRGVEVPEGFERAARERFRSGDSGPWDSVGISVRFSSERGGVVVYREGVATMAERGDTRWARLDVMLACSPARVTIGDIEIDVSAESVLTHASLEAALSDPVASRLDALVERGLAGDEPAIGEIERLLPIMSARLRARLDASPKAAGGPALRTILVGYDE
ncbi:radical SAM protein [Nannocystaceae bacterium ST9]